MAITVAITATGTRATTGASGGAAALEALARGTIVVVPFIVALYACRRPAHTRFGSLLLAFSLVWFVASLSAAGSPLIYSIGRVASWVAEVALAYVLLAFPTGRLEAKLDRMLIAFATGLVIVLFLPTALLVHQYPLPSWWASCNAGCPHNAFMVVRHQPGLLSTFVIPFREILVILVYVMVAGRLAWRIGATRSAMRRAVVPVLAVSSLRMFLFGLAVAVRRFAPHWSGMSATMWVLALLGPAIALAFLAGLVRWHLFVTRAIAAVNARLSEMPGPERVQQLLAEAFEDAKLEIARWSARQRQWIGVAGQQLRTPPGSSDRYLTEVQGGQSPRVAILHDVALRDDPAFVGVAATAASLAFETDRLTTRTSRMVQELRASRARVLSAADEERRRIERDLHDGAQQRLVGLSIHLELAAEQAEHERPGEAAELRELAGEVVQALEDLRALTHHIYPPVLTDRGLAAAVRAAALRSPVPANVEVDGLGELPQEIESAVYFCCTEALQNVAKHAGAAESVHVVLREKDSVLYFSVADDGPGMLDRDARVGAGLLNMDDRMKTVGGKLSIRSRPGHGTRVSGRVALSARARMSSDGGDPHGSRVTRTTRHRDRTES